MGLNLVRIKKIIDRYEYVSFDIFDTLLNRDVPNYYDVFTIIEKIYDQQSDRKTDFAVKRIQAERKARNVSKNREVTLEDIYAFYESEESEKKHLIDLEMYIEEHLLIPNAQVKKIYEYCIEQKKKIIITSDMYLSKSFLDGVLKKKGYKHFSRLYVSSDCGLKKRDGKLFAHVLTDLNIAPSSLIHIGDNIRSDFFMPYSRGIKAIHVERFIPKSKGDCAYLETFVHNRIAYFSDDLSQKMGYMCYGPLLYGFINFIRDKVCFDSTELVLFAARDSYIIKKAFDAIMSRNDISVKAEYFYISRRSIQVPMMSVLENPFKNVFRIVSFSPYSNLKAVLKRLGYDGGDTILRSIVEIADIINKDDYLRVKKEILENSKKEKDCFIRYIHELGIQSANCIFFVDVGWKCSSQISMKLILEKEIPDSKIQGIYLGVHPSAAVSDDEAEGYLFTGKMNDFYAVMGGMSVLEIFFMAPHGSAVKYSEDGIIFDQYEYENKDEFSNEIKFVSEAQSSAMRFIEDILNSPISNTIEFNKDIVFAELRRVMTDPTLDEIQKIGELRFDGANGIRPIIDWQGYKHYFLHPKDFITDYSQSGWKVGFLKKVFSVSLIPYILFKFSYKILKR